MASIAEMRMDTKLIADLCTRKCVEAEMECIERFQRHLKEKKLTKKEREELEEMIVERNQSINQMIKSDLQKQVSAAAKRTYGSPMTSPLKKEGLEGNAVPFSDDEESWHCCKCKCDFKDSEIEHIEEEDDAVCHSCCVKYGYGFEPILLDDEEDDGDVCFDRKYPNASCHRCETKLNSKTVVMCGGGGGECETWYCSTCHADGTHDCDVCEREIGVINCDDCGYTHWYEDKCPSKRTYGSPMTSPLKKEGLEGNAVPFPKPKKMIIIKLSKEENTKRKHRIEDDEPLNLVAERIRATKAF
jgi:hypothetical protein